jgi:RNA polymerase sigma-70 factor (ECF subfamily)
MVVTTAELRLPLLAEIPDAERADSPVHDVLVARARAGEREAFGDLLERHLPAARRLALAALGRQADADEAVQEASIVAWRRLDSLAADGAFRGWFLRIVWRKALDRRRSVRALMLRFIPERPDAGGGIADRPTSDAGPEASVLSSELERAAEGLLRALPRRLRDPFLLAMSGDHRYHEIARLLGIPVGSVKWRVSEARRLVRAKLERQGLLARGGR